MRPTLRLGVLNVFSECSYTRKRGGDLVIQFLTVCHNYKRPVAAFAPEDLLCKHRCRETLPGSLRVPKDTQPAMVFLDLCHGVHGAVHTKILVILRDDLIQAPSRLFKQDEVFNNVEEALFLARRAKHLFQSNTAGSFL